MMWLNKRKQSRYVKESVEFPGYILDERPNELPSFIHESRWVEDDEGRLGGALWPATVSN
eukprot:4873315-Karenia_brevis.AAC.1